MYELIEIDIHGDVNRVVKRVSEAGEEAFIPVDETNADYQQYLIDTDGGLPIPEGGVE